MGHLWMKNPVLHWLWPQGQSYMTYASGFGLSWAILYDILGAGELGGMFHRHTKIGVHALPCGKDEQSKEVVCELRWRTERKAQALKQLAYPSVGMHHLW